jgi:hypothetical protein
LGLVQGQNTPVWRIALTVPVLELIDIGAVDIGVVGIEVVGIEVVDIVVVDIVAAVVDQSLVGACQGIPQWVVWGQCRVLRLKQEMVHLVQRDHNEILGEHPRR